MRARRPDRQDFVERNGIKVGFEVYDGGQPALLLVPAAPITHGRSWKMIAPSLAGRFTVAVIDGRGTGRSDRPETTQSYAPAEVVADLTAVLDATGVDRAVLVAHCHAVPWVLRLASEHPERVVGIVAIAPWPRGQFPNYEWSWRRARASTQPSSRRTPAWSCTVTSIVCMRIYAYATWPLYKVA